MKIYTYIIIMLMLTGLASCSETKDPENATISVETGISSPLETEKEDSVLLTSSVDAPVPGMIECTGMIDLPPTAVYEGFARTGGYIREIRILEGQTVRSGQVVAVLESPDFARIQQEYLESLAILKWASAEYQRSEKLFQSQSISAKAYEQAQKDFEQAAAMTQGLEKELYSMGFATEKIRAGEMQQFLYITTPLNGTVTEVFVRTGERITPEDQLFTVINKNHMHVEMQVNADDIGKISKGQAFEFRTAGGANVYQGEVVLINDQVNLSTNTVKVHGHLKSPAVAAKLKIGERVFASFPVEEG